MGTMVRRTRATHTPYISIHTLLLYAQPLCLPGTSPRLTSSVLSDALFQSMPPAPDLPSLPVSDDSGSRASRLRALHGRLCNELRRMEVELEKATHRARHAHEVARALHIRWQATRGGPSGAGDADWSQLRRGGR